VIVVATGDFELCHDLVGELRARDAAFTTVEPGEGDPITERSVDPAPGEIRAIKDRARERSGDRTLPDALARAVAAGDLTLADALDRHGE